MLTENEKKKVFESLHDLDGNFKMMSKRIDTLTDEIKAIKKEIDAIKGSVDFIESFDENKIKGVRQDEHESQG